MKKLIGLFLVAGLLGSTLVAGAAEQDGKVVLMATTTSTENSGLLEYLLPAFEQDSGIEVRVTAVGTGKALRMGEDGDVDLLMVHAKPAEEKFVADGYGVKRHELMYNDFIMVGPKDDPAGLAKAKDLGEAMQVLSVTNTPFISRGDDSGTHKKELSLWQQAGVTPNEKGYRELGQGMGKTLQMADEMRGYTMIDRGTWLAYSNKVELDILFEGAQPLFNQYAVILVSPERYPDLNSGAAQQLIDWLVSDKGQTMIGEYKIKGKTLFVPNAGQ